MIPLSCNDGTKSHQNFVISLSDYFKSVCVFVPLWFELLVEEGQQKTGSGDITALLKKTSGDFPCETPLINVSC